MATPEEPSVPTAVPVPPAVEPYRSPMRRRLIAAALFGVLAALAGAGIAHAVWPAGSSSATSAVAAPNGDASGFGPPANDGGNPAVSPPANAAPAAKTTALAAAQVDPGIVDINTTSLSGGAAAGTGMVVTASGEVVTNNHVVAGATRITATDIGNGRTYTARVIGYDRTHDVAVLALAGASGLPTVPLGDSSTLRVGAAVVTVGNAGGVGGTPSAAGGSVTALSRSITAGDGNNGSYERLSGLIELSGQLQPGDSGGPLVDSSGKVVGMDTAASSGFSFQSASGSGFAVPINQVLTISHAIVGGRASSTIHVGPSALLGVFVASTSESGASPAPGVAVTAVIPGAPAARAGLTGGDTITSLGGQTVKAPSELTALVVRHHPGDHVRLTWLDAAGRSHSALLRMTTGPAA